MREPAFWWRRSGGTGAVLLAPVAAVYRAVAAFRLARMGLRVAVPVVCVGNPTLGGAGKTPLALTIARLLTTADFRPIFLSRGYGGELAGPLQVDPALHHADEVGDEPLLLARVAPTIVSRDRAKGAKAALAAGASVIVMDDGFQNPALAKDFSVLAVDARRGVGNARVLPAGPLRAPLDAQLARAHALVIVGAGDGSADVVAKATAANIPIFGARLEPDPGFVAALSGAPVMAFAGIGDPEKFYATLNGAGIAVVATRSFPDHHRFTAGQAQDLCRHADREGLVLVTTEKDLARMQGEPAMAELAAQSHALPVTMMLDDEAAFRALLLKRIERGP